ncbi:hypothetical protein OK016_20960 [Vibrio chagasii]|nr:hypothetical protein [Vibrio chagasii]
MSEPVELRTIAGVGYMLYCDRFPRNRTIRCSIGFNATKLAKILVGVSFYYAFIVHLA